MNVLTGKQEKVLSYITDYFIAERAMPTYREISKHFGYRSDNSAYEHVALIEKKGYLERMPNGRYRLSDLYDIQVSRGTTGDDNSIV